MENADVKMLSEGTRIGYVNLFVADMDKQVQFYTETIGLQVHWEKENAVGLGAGKQDILQLTLREGAVHYNTTTGLYHQAINVGSKKELARTIARIASKNVPQSPTDHTISWSTYLSDPERNTLEIYVPTPEEGTWKHNDEVFLVYDNQGNQRSGRDPLDVTRLYKQLSADDDIDAPLPEETFTGHVHLYVNDLHTAMHFYSEILGFERQSLMSRFQMAEVSVPGYPVHIIAFNTWKGPNAKPAPENATGLNFFSINYHSRDELNASVRRIINNDIPIEQHNDAVFVSDPVQNKILLTVNESE